MTQQFATTLSSFIAANYPLIVLRSQEEARALGLIHGAARAAQRTVETSSSLRAAPSVPTGLPTLSPLAALDGIKALATNAILVLCDLGPALSEPTVTRVLREMIPSLETRGITLIFLGPTPDIPDALAPDMVVMDLPLPDASVLTVLLQSLAAETGLSLGTPEQDRAVRAAQGLPLTSATRALSRAIKHPAGLGEDAIRGLVQEKRRILRGTDLLEFVDTPPALGAVGGLDQLKQWLAERAAAFGPAASAFGLPAPRGLLMVGVQGCGKSLTAKAIAHAWSLPLVRLEFGALFSANAAPEENLRRVLRLAEALSPVVLWIDEIDKGFSSMGQPDGGSEALSRVFSSFITWLQEKQAPVFVTATANAVDRLPPELLRKGRFDEIFFVDLPGRAEREEILTIHLKAHDRNPAAFDIAALATATEHFSGAELEQVVIAGLYRAFRRQRPLGDAELAQAVGDIVPLFRTYEESIKALREWAKGRARLASRDRRLSDLWGTQG